MQKRKHIKSAPNNIAQLVKDNGYKMAADKLGVTPAALNKYLRFKQAPKSTEIAAGSLLNGQDPENVTAVLQCEEMYLDVIKRIIESFGGNVTVIKY